MAKHLPTQFTWNRSNKTRLELIESPLLSIIKVHMKENSITSVTLPPEAFHMGNRLEALLKFCESAISYIQQYTKNCEFNVQLHDEEPKLSCFRFDASINEETFGTLIPDPYCLMTWGYKSLSEAFLSKEFPEWKNRHAIFFWRGSTTGINDLNIDNIENTIRYKLCEQSMLYENIIDAKFTSVVQTSNHINMNLILEKLYSENLLRSKIDPIYFGMHQWIFDIDGNVNSWGLLWKLLSGSCVIRVNSKRIQWYHHKLIPWEHLIPIQADLSDLGETLDWCMSHPSNCEQIGKNGQELAKSIIHNLLPDLSAACESYYQQFIKT